MTQSCEQPYDIGRRFGMSIAMAGRVKDYIGYDFCRIFPVEYERGFWDGVALIHGIEQRAL